MAICYGWNSTGLGEFQGFELEELLLVNHQGHYNDTIVTIEREAKEGPGAPVLKKDNQIRFD